MTISPSPLWQLKIRIHHAAVYAAVELLENLNLQAVSWYECEDAQPSQIMDDQDFPIAEEFYVEGYSKEIIDNNAIQKHLDILTEIYKIHMPSIHLSEVDNKDWLSVCYQQLPARQLGRYYVYGSHNDEPLDDNKIIPLKIDAATAFGSGDHPTTTGCLLALSDLADYPFQYMLDMGCGSGILAIAMAKTWSNGHVLAVDNDSESVYVSHQNAILNKCKKKVRTIKSEGFEDISIDLEKPFDLITANILAKPLCAMAPDFKKSLKTEGYIILSGLLDRQKQLVVQAYRHQKINLIKTYPIGQWVTLVLKNS